MKKALRHATSLVVVLFCFAAATGTAHAGWYYRAFALPKKPIADHGQKKQKKVINNLQKWIDGYGPKPDGIRMVGSTNHIHVWARKDKKGYKWRVSQVGTSPFKPNLLTGKLNARSARLGGFLRIYEKQPGQKMDYQKFLRLDLVKGKKLSTKPWHYTHVKATGKHWKNVLEQFINSHGPSEASGIQGGLSNGKDFHIWVRADESSKKWKLKHVPMPSSGSYGLLNGAIKTKVAQRRVAPIGFNVKSALWYAERK